MKNKNIMFFSSINALRHLRFVNRHAQQVEILPPRAGPAGGTDTGQRRTTFAMAGKQRIGLARKEHDPLGRLCRGVRRRPAHRADPRRCPALRCRAASRCPPAKERFSALHWKSLALCLFSVFDFWGHLEFRMCLRAGRSIIMS